jgi:hypothetical protein
MKGSVAFHQCLSSGDTSKVTDTKGSVAAFNQDLSSGAFNQDLSSGDTSKVIDGILPESLASSRLCAA